MWRLWSWRSGWRGTLERPRSGVTIVPAAGRRNAGRMRVDILRLKSDAVRELRTQQATVGAVVTAGKLIKMVGQELLGEKRKRAVRKEALLVAGRQEVIEKEPKGAYGLLETGSRRGCLPSSC